MRIGIDASCWANRRGFGRFARELVPALVELGRSGGEAGAGGHDQHEELEDHEDHDEYVLFADQATAQRADFPRGCRVVTARTSAAAADRAAARGRRPVRDMLAMRRLVRREPLDVMFFPAVYSYFPVARPVPCAVTFHDVIAEMLPRLVFPTARGRFFWNLKCRLALRRCARVLTVSEASKRGLIDHFRLPADRVRVVGEAPSRIFAEMGPAPADPAALARHGLEPGARFLLYVGGISPHKNLDTLLRAFVRVARELTFRDLLLVLAGDTRGDTFHTCYQELAARVRSLRLEGRVLFPGYVADEDLRHLYAAAEAFVFPSYLEGFGLPAVEAMACGAPVVASNRGSLPEVVGEAGEYFDPHDAEDLASALRRVLADPARRAELRARSLARSRHFTWERAARQVREALAEIAAPPVRPLARVHPR